jgi:hypothetical protein
MTTSSHDGLQTMLTVPLADAGAGAGLPALVAVCAEVDAAARTKGREDWKAQGLHSHHCTVQ